MHERKEKEMINFIARNTTLSWVDGEDVYVIRDIPKFANLLLELMEKKNNSA